MKNNTKVSVLAIFVLAITISTPIIANADTLTTIQAYGVGLWKSDAGKAELEACRLTMERQLTFGAMPATGFFEADLLKGGIKRAAVKLQYDKLNIMVGKQVSGYAWYVSGPGAEWVASSTPVFNIMTAPFQTGVGVNYVDPKFELHAGAYGRQFGAEESWSAAITGYQNLLGIKVGATLAMTQLADKQAMTKLSLEKGWLKSEAMMISSGQNDWSSYHPDSVAGHFRLTISPTSEFEFYTQLAMPNTVNGVTVGGNMIFAPNSRLMLAYNRIGETNQVIARATWYLKKSF